MPSLADAMAYDLDRVLFDLAEGVTEAVDFSDGTVEIRIRAQWGAADIDAPIPPGQALGDLVAVWIPAADLTAYGGLYQPAPAGRRGYTLTRYPDDLERREAWQVLPGTVERSAPDLWRLACARIGGANQPGGLRAVPRG